MGTFFVYNAHHHCKTSVKPDRTKPSMVGGIIVFPSRDCDNYLNASDGGLLIVCWRAVW